MTNTIFMKRLAVALALWGGFGLAVAVAQMPPPPTPTPTTPPTTPPTQVPLDGGVILLAAAGAAYGAKKMHARKKATRA